MQTPLAIGASLLAVLIWVISRRRLQLPPVQAQRAGLAPSFAAVAQLSEAAAAPSPGSAAVAGQHAQLPVRVGRVQRLRQLTLAMSAGPLTRLAAMEALIAQPDHRALPLIRRGLRDSNAAVVLAAVQAMGPFRGYATAAAQGPAPARVRLPRNAAPRG